MYLGYAFTKFRLFFHKVSFIINTPFPPLQEMLYASCIKLLAETPEFFTHAVFQLVIVHKTASLECLLQRAKKMEVRGGLNWDCREDEGEQSTSLLQLSSLCADWCVVLC
jgi:hypothetical protein